MKLQLHQIRLIANWFRAAAEGRPVSLEVPDTLTGNVLRVRMAEIERRNPHLFPTP